jgi:hypothetical protein
MRYFNIVHLTFYIVYLSSSCLNQYAFDVIAQRMVNKPEAPTNDVTDWNWFSVIQNNFFFGCSGCCLMTYNRICCNPISSATTKLRYRFFATKVVDLNQMNVYFVHNSLFCSRVFLYKMYCSFCLFNWAALQTVYFDLLWMYLNLPNSI